MEQDERDRAYAAGRTEWPSLLVDAEYFAARSSALPVPASPAELYLAMAVEVGAAGAAAAFEQRYMTDLRAMLSGQGGSASEVDEVLQQVRVKLLTTRFEGRLPLVEYAGRGSMDGLVRVTARRMLIDLQSKHARDDNVDDWLGALVAPDLENAVVAAEEKAEVQRAIQAALKAVGAKERALLRMHFVNGLGIDPIAKMLNVHRATAARHLVKAKEELVERVRDTLAQRWGGDQLSRIANQIELSLTRLFETTLEPEPSATS